MGHALIRCYLHSCLGVREASGWQDQTVNLLPELAAFCFPAPSCLSPAIPTPVFAEAFRAGQQT